MRKTYIASVLFIVLIVSIISGYSFFLMKKVPTEKCHTCRTTGSSDITPRYNPSIFTLDTENGGYWLITFNERPGQSDVDSLNEEWVRLYFNINIDGNISINCSANKKTASYFIQEKATDSQRTFYIWESSPGSARYDKDFGVDGKTDRIDSDIKEEHLQTLENVTMAFVDEDGDSFLEFGDTIYIFRQFYLPGNKVIKINCDQDLIITCDDGSHSIIVRQKDLVC